MNLWPFQGKLLTPPLPSDVRPTSVKIPLVKYLRMTEQGIKVDAGCPQTSWDSVADLFSNAKKQRKDQGKISPLKYSVNNVS